MKVGWLADLPVEAGGAELTQFEFRQKAPTSVEIVDCRPGAVVAGCDRYVVHNCVTYSAGDLEAIGPKPIIKYVHDAWPHGDAMLRDRLLARARLVFCSPLHVERFAWPLGSDPAIVPPAIDLKAPTEMPREGNVWLGRFQPGKGLANAVKWARQTGERLDVYGDGPARPPTGEGIALRGPVRPSVVKTLLSGYQRFVFLPDGAEPFGRTVVEAWAAGCELVVNALCGALYYLRESQGPLYTAAEDFWAIVREAG